MGVPSQPLPTIGQPNSTEDAKVRSALSEMQTILSGNVDATNLAAKAITSAKLFPTAAIVTSTVGINSFDFFSNAVLTYNFITAVPTRQLVMAYGVVSLETDANGAIAQCSMELLVDGVAQPGAPAVLIGGTTSGSQAANAALNRADHHTLFGVWLPTMTAGAKTLAVRMTGDGSALSNVTVPVGAVTMVRLELAA